MQYEEYPQLSEARELLRVNAIEPICPTPFAFLFVGFDGQHYLCCSDWRKEVPLGHVADASFVDVMLDKLAHTRTRNLVCKTCNLDPVNKLVEAMRARDGGEADAPEVSELVEKIRGFAAFAHDEIEALTGAPVPPADPADAAGRRTIPVTAI
jgi:hypothetical protein